jgi:hypothetical protein
MASRLNVSNLLISSGGSIKLPVFTNVSRPSPETGLIIFNENSGVELYNGTDWKSLGGAANLNKVELFSTGSQSFASTGLDQTWTVPEGVIAIKAWMWGAGGGAGGISSASQPGGNGGGAGALDGAVIQVTPGEVLTLRAGQAVNLNSGNPGATTTAGYSFTAFGGGARGGVGDGGGANGSHGSPGGGATSILRGSTFIAIAAGGGGGGGPGYPSAPGGAGGAGGAGNGNGGLGPGTTAGEGGNGTNGGGGGGGGGSGSSQNQGAGVGGQGGSNLLPAQPLQIQGVPVTPGISVNGSGRNPGNSSSSKYPGGIIGFGGQGATTASVFIGGGDGYIYIEY